MFAFSFQSPSPGSWRAGRVHGVPADPRVRSPGICPARQVNGCLRLDSSHPSGLWGHFQLIARVRRILCTQTCIALPLWHKPSKGQQPCLRQKRSKKTTWWTTTGIWSKNNNNKKQKHVTQNEKASGQSEEKHCTIVQFGQKLYGCASFCCLFHVQDFAFVRHVSKTECLTDYY